MRYTLATRWTSWTSKLLAVGTSFGIFKFLLKINYFFDVIVENLKLLAH
jgi:hypothetical protein